MQDLVLHVTGARPNFPKAAPVISALDSIGVEQRLVHTGQHYDDNMSAVFFRELELPAPDVNLGVGSGSHATQTASIMTALEKEVLQSQPRLVVVYGDVNSTVAAALVMAKLGIAVAHVEAGLRSGDWSMPEEINRVVTDRLSDRLYATSADAVGHLASEGVPVERVRFVGNPMIDTLLKHRAAFDGSKILAELDLSGRYAVATLHRPGNVDSAESLAALTSALAQVADQVDVILPVHPRGAANLQASGLLDHPRIHAVEPVGYTQFLGLVDRSALVVTDSGGIQEETTVLGVPCLTLRPNTERPVTITDGTNQLVTPETLPTAASDVLAAGRPSSWPVPPLWDGRAGQRIAEDIASFLH